jgi:hypothetical protein
LDILQIKLLIKGNDQGVVAVEALPGVDICIRAGALVLGGVYKTLQFSLSRPALVTVMGPGGK